MLSPEMLNQFLTIILTILVIIMVIVIVRLNKKLPLVLNESEQPIAGATNKDIQNKKDGAILYICEYMDGFTYKYISIANRRVYNEAMLRIKGER